jgi:hypothetical protein
MEYKLKHTNDDDHDLIVEGLEPGSVLKKYYPELTRVVIFPGLHNDCQTDASFHQGIGTQLYDLFQIEMGANLRDGDTFVYEEKGWKWECSHVHVLPVKGTYPQEWNDYED